MQKKNNDYYIIQILYFTVESAYGNCNFSDSAMLYFLPQLADFIKCFPEKQVSLFFPHFADQG